MEFVSNEKAPNDKPHKISCEHWKELPDFKPSFPELTLSLRREASSFLALIFWLSGLFVKHDIKWGRIR